MRGRRSSTYVKNADDGVYFKVPNGWQRIEHEAMDWMLSGEDPASMAAAARRERIWSVGYDASIAAQPLHLFLGTGDEPFVYAMVRRLSEDEINAVSLNGARDLLLPVTDSARADNAANPVFQGFELVSDEILPTEGTVRGVRSVFNYSPGGGRCRRSTRPSTSTTPDGGCTSSSCAARPRATARGRRNSTWSCSPSR